MLEPCVYKINFKRKRDRLRDYALESSASPKKYIRNQNKEESIYNVLDTSKTYKKVDNGLTNSVKFNFMKETINSKNKKILNSPQLWKEGINQTNNSQSKILLYNIKKYNQISLKSYQNQTIEPFLNHVKSIEKKINQGINQEHNLQRKDLSLESLEDNDRPNLEAKINNNNSKIIILNENKLPLNIKKENKSKEILKNALQIKYDKALRDLIEKQKELNEIKKAFNLIENSSLDLNKIIEEGPPLVNEENNMNLIKIINPLNEGEIDPAIYLYSKSTNKYLFNIKDNYQAYQNQTNLDTSNSQQETLKITKNIPTPIIEQRHGDLVESIISNDII